MQAPEGASVGDKGLGAFCDAIHGKSVGVEAFTLIADEKSVDDDALNVSVDAESVSGEGYRRCF